MIPPHEITVDRPQCGPLCIRVQIDASLSLADALALRAELDRAISAVQSERQMQGIIEEAAETAAHGIDAQRWAAYAMGRPMGSEGGE